MTLCTCISWSQFHINYGNKIMIHITIIRKNNCCYQWNKSTLENWIEINKTTGLSKSPKFGSWTVKGHLTVIIIKWLQKITMENFNPRVASTLKTITKYELIRTPTWDTIKDNSIIPGWNWKVATPAIVYRPRTTWGEWRSPESYWEPMAVQRAESRESLWA